MIDHEWVSTDRTLKRIMFIVEECAALTKIRIFSIVLFGSRARGDRNSLNDYEIMVLIEDGIELSNYIYLNNTIRLELMKAKLFNVRILVYNQSTFENTLFSDKLVGTFLYMICKENIIVSDKDRIFLSIRDRVLNSVVKPEEEFIQQCVEFANSFGSEKWAQKWEKALMQHKYLKKRRDF